MKIPEKAFWLALGLLMLGLLLTCKAAVTQGSGAIQLVKSAKVSQSISSLTPPAAMPPLIEVFFAATATNEIGESEYSNEVSTTNRWPMLAWDASTNANGYRIYRGQESRVYTEAWPTGTNLTFTVPRPYVPTNLVITITSSLCTNLQYSTTLKGPWTLYGSTNLVVTNPVWGNSRFWRGVGRPTANPKQVYMRKLYQ